MFVLHRVGGASTISNVSEDQSSHPDKFIAYFFDTAHKTSLQLTWHVSRVPVQPGSVARDNITHSPKDLH